VAGGIFTHLVHLKTPHWAIGMATDIATGAVVGLVLAGAGAWIRRLAPREA
jgi:uncharacterized membrane protein